MQICHYRAVLDPDLRFVFATDFPYESCACMLNQHPWTVLESINAVVDDDIPARWKACLEHSEQCWCLTVNSQFFVTIVRKFSDGYYLDSWSFPSGVADLSQREAKTLRCLGTLLDIQAVARKLEISVSTVRTYLQRIQMKTGGIDRNEMLLLAVHYDNAKREFGKSKKRIAAAASETSDNDVGAANTNSRLK